MFEKRFQYSSGEKEFNLALARDQNWSEGKKRVLIVLETVPSQSLKDKELLGPKLVRNTIVNCIKYSKGLAETYGAKVSGTQWAVVNFNASKHMHLAPTQRHDAELGFARRTMEIIEKLRPTHVLVSGDKAAELLIGMQYQVYKRGWVTDKDGILYTGTLDLDDLLKHNGENANLLGVWCRNLANLLLGKMAFDLSHVVATPVYAGTMDRAVRALDIVEKRITAGDHIAFDTEGKSLDVLDNPIYTVQFATENNPQRGFVIPLDHPMTPFNPKEIKQLKRRLRTIFERPDLLLITQNGAFDARQVREQFRIPIIPGHIYDIQAGEHLLDENTYNLVDVGPSMGGLDSFLCAYGNDFYMGAKFGKKDRTTTGLIRPDDADFLKYCAMDVVALQYLRFMQLKRAATVKHVQGPWRPMFEAHMKHIMSDTVHTLSHLRQDGSYVDMKYLRSQLEEDSDINREMRLASRKLRNTEVGVACNKAILKEQGWKSKNLFKSEDPWVFSLNKPAHKVKLCIEQLGLEPLSMTDSGQPQVDKNFIAHYKGQHKELEIVDSWLKRNKIYSTYFKGWHKRLSSDPDGMKDHTIKADYGFWGVNTGRLSSYKPNLQQIPSRGNLSKMVKRSFIAPPGHMMVRFDYSAHEVRMWSVVAGDKKLAAAFQAGLELRQKLIQDPFDAEIRETLKKKGDIHIQNVYRFYRKWVSKDDPMRDSIKSTIFGLLYGKSARSMGRDIGPKALARKKLHKLKDRLFLASEKDLSDSETLGLANALKKADAEKFTDISAARKLIQQCVVEIKEEIKELRSTLGTEKADEKEDTKYAQSIIDKTLQEFRLGAKWLEDMAESAKTHYYVYSPAGRRRHLFACLTGDESILSQQIRRGANAPIQGFASELGVKAGRLINQAYYKHAERLLERLAPDSTVWDMRLRSARLVHDACYFAVPYCMVLPLYHMLQYQATFGLEAAATKELGINFTVVPEIEVEIGFCDTQTIKLDWTFEHLLDSIKKSVEDGAKEGFVTEPVDEVVEKILSAYRDPKVRKFLNEKYPVLNVPGMEEHVKEALKAFDEKATV